MHKDIVFVSDFYVEEAKGGAELTTEALLSNSPYNVKKILSRNLTLQYAIEKKESFWIFGNFSHLKDEVKIYFAKNLFYSVIEYDYKYCKFRSDDLHKKTSGHCDCESTNVGKINSIFLSKSKLIWWMSENQRNHYFEKFSFLKKTKNIVLSSAFSKEAIEYFEQFQNKNTQKNNKWVIMNSPSWIKNVDECVEYAKSNSLEYDLVWGLPYSELLEKLSLSKGLVFLPSGKDTCPRLVIEAKLLGCELVLNDNVQHKDESWFENTSKILNHLKTRPSFFWSEISNHV